jgi:hypothetical protein
VGVVSTGETLTRYVWADTPSSAWGLVTLTDDGRHAPLARFVHDSREDAERADTDNRIGHALYRVERTSILADESTPAPQGEEWVFTYSTEGRANVWSKPNRYSPFPDAERFDGYWTFPEPLEPIERAARANLEARTVDSGEAFRVYLLTWSVGVVETETERKGAA